MSSVAAALCLAALHPVLADMTPKRGVVDSRIRVVAYDPEQVITLRGYVGYQIHFQFAEGESFVNLAAGDNKALDVGYEANHLVLKPLAEKVATNITLITTRHVYQFDYSATSARPNPAHGDVIYSLRFTYPLDEARSAADQAAQERESYQRAHGDADPSRMRNSNYWGCGDLSIRPVRASDDGVQTRLRFAAHAEFPAMYVKNEDASESLLNFTVEGEDVLIHRVSHHLILRRGELVACLENRAFDGGGEHLPSETLLPDLERRTKGSHTP